MGVRGGEGPEAVKCRLELTLELEWIEPLVEGLEFVPCGGRQHARRAQPLRGRLGTIEHAAHTGARALLAHELFDRLEEVDVPASQGVDAGQLGIGALGGEAIIADEMADDGPVLLLHMRAVVLLPGAAAGEGDALADTVSIQGLGDELRAVVPAESW